MDCTAHDRRAGSGLRAPATRLFAAATTCGLLALCAPLPAAARALGPLPGPAPGATVPAPPVPPRGCTHVIVCGAAQWEDDAGPAEPLSPGERLARCGEDAGFVRERTGSTGRVTLGPDGALHPEPWRSFPVAHPFGDGPVCRTFAWASVLVEDHQTPAAAGTADTGEPLPETLPAGTRVEVLAWRDGWAWTSPEEGPDRWIPADALAAPREFLRKHSELLSDGTCPAWFREGLVHVDGAWLFDHGGAPIVPIPPGTRVPLTCTRRETEAPEVCRPYVAQRAGSGWYEVTYLGQRGFVPTGAVAVDLGPGAHESFLIVLDPLPPPSAAVCPVEPVVVVADDLRLHAADDGRIAVELGLGAEALPSRPELSTVVTRVGVVLSAGRVYPVVHGHVGGGATSVSAGGAVGVFWEPLPEPLTRHVVLALGASTGWSALVPAGVGPGGVVHRLTQTAELRFGVKGRDGITGVQLGAGIAEDVHPRLAVSPFVSLRVIFEFAIF